MTVEPTDESRLGESPTTLRIPIGSPPPQIRVIEYDEHGLEEKPIADVDELVPYARTRRTTWVDIQGLGDESILRRVAEIFGIHILALADAIHAPQRAKMELYDAHLFLVARAPEAPFDPSQPVPQVCLLVSEDYLISFQERHFGFFEGVRARIRSGGGLLRRAGTGYLGYALIDSLIDHYYPAVTAIADELDDLQELVLAEPDPNDVVRLHEVQRRITTLRRVMRPQVEALHQLSQLGRGDHASSGASSLMPESTLPFLRDVYDHARQIEGRLDSAREMAGDTMAAILASLGHRQNEVMKLLTLVGSIFIPLTFLAGIYGMNFEHMPELGHPYAYPVLLGVMAVAAVGMILFFRHKGWIGGRRRRGPDQKS